jgi:pyridoxamine 5'-phosphate oxidase
MPSIDPLPLFLADRARAQAAGEPWDATVCALATSDARGAPSVRFVLVKEVDGDGFWFYTNYRSRKASELDARPEAALAFLFDRIHVQYRVEGTVTRAPAERSEAYFASRPRISQLGAWASEQSQPVPPGDWLTERMGALEARFAETVPRPEHWGGFVLRPSRIERWTEGPFRLHRRELFTRAAASNEWESQELQP